MGKVIERAKSITDFHSMIENYYYSGESYALTDSSSAEFSIATMQAGLLPLSKFCGAPMGLRRTWMHIRQHPSDRYVIWFPRQGNLRVSQDSMFNNCCEPGNFVITYGDRPFHVRATGNESECTQLHVIVPSHIIRSRLPDIDHYCGRTFSAFTGSAKIGADIYASLIDEGDEVSAASIDNFGMAALDALCDVVRRVTREAPGPTDHRQSQLQRVLRHIDQHIPTQGLIAEQVAQACKMSRRYLHYLLRESELTFAGYLWEARLQQARKWLLDPEFAHFHIVDVAYMCGFSSASHFSSAYRARFNQSPRDERDAVRKDPGVAHRVECVSN